jgi:hypothetical protein
MRNAAKEFPNEEPSASHPVTPRQVHQLNSRMIVGLVLLAVLTVAGFVYLGVQVHEINTQVKTLIIRSSTPSCQEDNQCKPPLPCHRGYCDRSLGRCAYTGC